MRRRARGARRRSRPGFSWADCWRPTPSTQLRALGITHVLRAKDEIPHDAHEGTFVYEGVRGIRDVSSRENAEAFRKTFTKISAFLDAATETNDVGADVVNDDETRSHETKNTKNTKKTGGGVLVHCFEGKSRSATAVAQHLIRATPGSGARRRRAAFHAAKRADARASNRGRAKALPRSRTRLNASTALHFFKKSRRSRRNVMSLATTRGWCRVRGAAGETARWAVSGDARRDVRGVRALGAGARSGREHRDMYAREEARVSRRCRSCPSTRLRNALTFYERLTKSLRRYVAGCHRPLAGATSSRTGGRSLDVSTS